MTFPSLAHPIYLILPLLTLIATPISGLPTIAIVPGAWQSPIHYTKLTTLLRDEGYTVVSSSHPSIGSLNPETQTAATDAAFIHDHTLVPLIVEQGEDVVLVMHGYGGLVGSAAAAGGLSKVERKGMDLPGGIIGMIFIAAFVSRTGRPLVELLPGGRLEEWVLQYPNTQTFPSTNPTPLFYNDIPNPHLSALFAHELRNQSLASLTTTTPGIPAWVPEGSHDHYHQRRAYAFTTRDRVVPLAAQEAMAGLAGVDFYTRFFDAGHSPFLSVPDVLAEWVEGMAMVWEYGMGGAEGAVGVT